MIRFRFRFPDFLHPFLCFCQNFPRIRGYSNGGFFLPGQRGDEGGSWLMYDLEARDGLVSHAWQRGSAASGLEWLVNNTEISNTVMRGARRDTNA